MPENDADRNGYIKRMLCSVLRNFQCEVRSIDNFLRDSGNLVTEDHRIFSAFFWNELIQHDRLSGLFCAHYRISIFLKPADCIHSVFHVLPLDAVFSS